ncbi:ribonuclease T, partial [Escherichia coli]|nr:ribonuclease T [Escherichia coli]
MMRKLVLGFLGTGLALLPGIASAQAMMCPMPGKIERPRPDL